MLQQKIQVALKAGVPPNLLCEVWTQILIGERFDVKKPNCQIYLAQISLK